VVNRQVTRLMCPTPQTPPAAMSRADWSRLGQALRPLLKDPYRYSVDALVGEGEAFHKLSKLSMEVNVAAKLMNVRIVLRSVTTYYTLPLQ